jgi:hypothetical protein
VIAFLLDVIPCTGLNEAFPVSGDCDRSVWWVEIRKRNGPVCRCDRNDVFFLLSHVVDRPGERSIPGIVSNTRALRLPLD